MAKTKLNDEIDNFFSKYKNQSITKDIVSKSLNIKAVNEYGSILHAIVNYEYPQKSVLELIEILLDLGVDPNYKAKLTGYTFIHLMFYGYTNSEGEDISYSEDFILKVLKLATSHGFDANSVDNDKDTIVMAAIASEVYTGSIEGILNALNGKYKVDEKLLKFYDEQLNASESYEDETKVKSPWHTRLQEERDTIFKYYEQASDIDYNQKIKSILDKLSPLFKNLNYQWLKNNYESIKNQLLELDDLIIKAKPSNSITNAKKQFTSFNERISAVLTKKIATIKKAPDSSQIAEILVIVTFLKLDNLIKQVTTIKGDYESYLASLHSKSQSLSTINQCEEFLAEVQHSEIYDQLKKSVFATKQHLEDIIEKYLKCYEEYEKLSDALSLNSTEKFIRLDCPNAEEKIILEKTESLKEYNLKYHLLVRDYISEAYFEILKEFETLIDMGYLTRDDLVTCLDKSLKLIADGRPNHE